MNRRVLLAGLSPSFVIVASMVLSSCEEKVAEPTPSAATSGEVGKAATVDLKQAIEAASLPSGPVEGRVQNLPFSTKLATIVESKCDEEYVLRLFDRTANDGERWDEVSSDRAVALTFPASARPRVEGGATPLSLVAGDAAFETVELAYGLPLPKKPDNVVRAEAAHTALYLELTQWTEGEADERGRLGKAKGKLSLRASPNRGETGLWLEGTLEAIIVEGPGCLP